MKIVAYLYSDPLIESPCKPDIWGLEVDQVYSDLGGREQLQQLLSDAEDNPPDYLLIRQLDELGDRLEQVIDNLTHLENLGVEIIATQQDYSSSKPNDPQGIKVNLGQLLQEVSERQRQRRLRQGHARTRLNASPPPGKAPYGYRRGKDRYILDRSTAPVVKDFLERFLLFGSLRGSVRYLENKYGKKISVSTGRRWLTSPVYRGNTAYQNDGVIGGTHAAILSPEEAAQVDRLLRRNRRLPPRTASAPRSLAGLVRCQTCESNLKVTSVTQRGKDKEYLYLSPIHCPKQPKCKGIRYEQILEGTIKQICQELPKAVANLDRPDVDSIKGRLLTAIQEKQIILEQVQELESTGVLDEQTASLRSYTLKTELTELQNRLSQLPPVNLSAIAQTVSIPQFWLDLSEAERRFYFREFLRSVEIVRHPDSSWTLQLVFIF
jgi:DNA invertase Pin-like site-specific DNA recombinase